MKEKEKPTGQQPILKTSHPLNWICPSCGTENYPDDAKCRHCGWSEDVKFQKLVVSTFHELYPYSSGPHLNELAIAMERAAEYGRSQLRAEVEKLQKFKDYVHKRLDDAGVPVDPESPHKAAGCRIGGRLDHVFTEMYRQAERIRELEGEVTHWKGGYQAACDTLKT